MARNHTHARGVCNLSFRVGGANRMSVAEHLSLLSVRCRVSIIVFRSRVDLLSNNERTDYA